MDQYVCKIAAVNEMNEKWDYEIARNPGDSAWPIWKKSAIAQARSGQSIPYYGILNGRIIAEATASLDCEIVQNSQGLVDEKTAYLSAFRTIEGYRGQGYFSRLLAFMLEDLKRRGYERVTLGVEPGEIENIMIYFHYGFTEYIKMGVEVYPNGEKINVIYYGKEL